MTVVDFYLKIVSGFFREKNVSVTAAAADMKSEFEVSVPDFLSGLSDIGDYLFDWMEEQLLPAAENAYDDGRISEDELNIFKAVMKVIEW